MPRVSQRLYQRMCIHGANVAAASCSNELIALLDRFAHVDNTQADAENVGALRRAHRKRSGFIRPKDTGHGYLDHPLLTLDSVHREHRRVQKNGAIHKETAVPNVVEVVLKVVVDVKRAVGAQLP